MKRVDCQSCGDSGFFALHGATCGACGRAHKLCAQCLNVFVACNEECRKKYQEMVKDVFRK